MSLEEETAWFEAERRGQEEWLKERRRRKDTKSLTLI